MWWIIGLIALAAFDRIFIPPLDRYGRRPLIEVWVGYVSGMASGIEEARKMEAQVRLQAKLQEEAYRAQYAQPDSQIGEG